MADDTTTEATGETTDATETDTTTATADETSGTGTEDVTGLKSALASEREQRKAAEKAAKANATKAAKLDEIEAANKTEAEKLQAKAEQAEKKAKAATDRAVKAEVRSVARDLKFVDPADALRLVDLSELADDDGEVDEAAVTKALKKVAKDKPYLLKGEGGASGGDFTGSPGAAASIDQQIADAEKNRDFARAIALKRQKAALRQ